MKAGLPQASRRRREAVAALGRLGALVVVLSSSCARPSESPSAELQAAHAAADRAKGPQQQRSAAAALERAAEAIDAQAPVSRELRFDLTSRAARLHMELGDAGRSRQLLLDELQDLDSAPSPSPLLAQLYLDLADAEAALGDGPAERRALLAALTIHSQLFDQEIADP